MRSTSKTLFKIGATALGGVLILAGAAQAQERPSLAFNLGAASDYSFRGVSQTDEEPQIFGGADITSGQFYSGVWASNVDFGDGADAEIDLYAGVKPTLGVATLDLGFIYYGYVNAPSGADYGNVEAKVAASIPAGPATIGAAAFYSPDGFGAADESLYVEVNAAAPIGDRFTLNGAVGRQAYDGPGDYTTWNVGVAYALTPKIAADLRYHDTDRHEFGKLYDSRVVVGLKAAF